MKKRKVTALLCAVLVIGCAITGCGGRDSKNVQGNGAGTEQAQGRQPMNGMEMTMGLKFCSHHFLAHSLTASVNLACVQ